MHQHYRPGRAWLITVLLYLFIVVNFLDKISIGLLAAPLMDEMHLSPAEFGLIGSSFFWLFAVAGVVGGFISNRVRTTRLLFVMAVAWSLCQLPLAWSSSVGVFILMRVLLGITEGPATPISIHACYKWFPDDKRVLPVAFFTQGGATGMILAGLLIPAVTAMWGWRANFYVLAVLGALWALAWLVIGKEGEIEEAAHGSADTRRLPYRVLLTDPTVIGCFALRFTAYWTLALSLTWFVAYLQRGLGFGHATAGQLFALIIAINAPVTLLVAWLSQRMLKRGATSRAARGQISAAMLLLGGFCLVAMMLPGLSPVWKVVALGGACCLAPAIYSLGPAMLAEVTPPSQRGAVLSVDASVSSVAGIIAPLVTGFLVQNATGSHGYEMGFALGGLVMIVGALLGLAIINPEKSRRTLADRIDGVQETAGVAPAAQA
jgi:MFS family permease